MFANFNLFLEWLPTHWQSTAEATYDAARWPRCETAPRTHTPRRSARTSRAVRHRLPRGTHRPRDGSRPVRRCPPPAVNLFTTMSDLRTHKQSIGFSRSSRIFWICGYIAYCIFSRGSSKVWSSKLGNSIYKLSFLGFTYRTNESLVQVAQEG